ncbi:MAG: protoglobin domain-containing protein [Deltaproteobacteria bacterium]|nr:protoglobin domain-containing protein [Deltaproteobacteria bacterium]
MTDSAFLTRLMAQTGFTQEDADHLSRLLPAVEPRARELADRFYGRIVADQEAFATLGGSEARAERLKVTMVRWIVSGLSGPHDLSWLEARARIGRVHVQIELPQHLMVTAMNGLRQDLREILEETLAGAGEARLATSRALDRLLDLELAIMLDTYREDSLSRLARHERLATIGELAASIAHDLRNPLGVIESSLFLLRRKVSEEDGASRHLQKIHRQVERCNRIITDLLDLVRGREPTLGPVELEAFFAGVLEQSELPENLEVKLEIEPGASLVCDESLATQALCNLVANARQAIGRAKGTIVLSAHAGEEGCELRVSDDGPGFPPELLTQAFEPLVTGRSSGVGLGLAIARGIVERHGGHARALNGEEGGASVRLFFPREGAAAGQEGGRP